MPSILRATDDDSRSECSQTLTTLQPRFRSNLDTSRSRALFREILGVQKPWRDLGIRQCQRQPCQKQPSTKTATRSRRNTKSGLPGNDCCRRQPLIPCARKMDISFNSVSLFPFERTSAITSERFLLLHTSGTSRQ